MIADCITFSSCRKDLTTFPQALIKEDKLLARIELLESQLEIFTRDPTEYQNRIITLEEEKHKYQIHAKDSLRLICQEKSDALRQCSDLENSLTAGMIEVQHYKGLYDTTLEDQLKSEDSLRKKVAEVQNKYIFASCIYFHEVLS